MLANKLLMEGKRKPLIKILPKDARKHTHARRSSGLEPNDVPTAFNNCLFIEGVILQEPAEGFWGVGAGGVVVY